MSVDAPTTNPAVPRKRGAARGRLLDLAETAVLEKGFSGTSIEELIVGAGITKSGFFYHFPDKSALAKALLWRGTTLMGLMLADLLAAFEYLAARPDVDTTRIATFGLSMGATHAYFLAVLEPRVARAAHLCAYADLDSLIETGAHDLHGHYMTVPGLLAATSTGRIAGMVAPRPQLICTGDHDPLTPPDAVDTAYRQTRAAYETADAATALTRLSQPETGHEETPQMRRAVLEFLSAMR
jgi:AcrR family transcriptional regulator